ncbi:MAG: adenylate/guanylate cyclase domain-containing protein, partial [Pseudomonadota bacterium]
MTAHIPAFEKAAIELDILADLSDEDLKELGLPLGDRRRLNKALATMPPREMDAFGTAFDLMQRHPLRGEHRQISTLYCDLVRWMTLAADNDLEDLREPLRRCREAWKTAVAKFDGFVAGFAGDGMIAHFGHPQTHEDDAERAIYAGLAILDAMPAVRTACPSDIGQRLSVRIGIATGRVLVGDIVKTSFSEEIGVLGSAPCFAYRLQGLAEPGSILISDATHRLTKRRFAF